MQDLLRILFLGASLLFISHCSLNLDDPESNARKAIHATIPSSKAVLLGEWLGDSTYTLKDSEAQKLGEKNGVTMEFYPDGVARIEDSLHRVFTQSDHSLSELKGDTLWLTSKSSTPTIKKYLLKFSFLGNYLEVFDPIAIRYTYFHKYKTPELATWKNLLPDTLWELKGYRSAGDTLKPETFQNAFAYLQFTSDTLSWENTMRGLSKINKGRWSFKGDTLNWTFGSNRFLMQCLRPDSLRLWPIHGGKLDTGFYAFRKVSKKQMNYRDMNTLPGYWRMDSIVLGNNLLYGHYGQYCDFSFNTEHHVSLLTNMQARLPHYQDWDSDSGFFWLLAKDTTINSSATFSLKQETYTVNDSVLKFSMNSINGYPQIVFYCTHADSSLIAKDPLNRFNTSPFVQMYAGQDTFSFYFNPVRHVDTLEHYEIAQWGTDTTWIISNIKTNQENFNSGQSGFKLMFNAKEKDGKKVRWQNLSNQDLVIRITNNPQSTILNGLIQGFMQEHWLDSSHADTLRTVTGVFRFVRKKSAELTSPLWLF